jgi:hypothetical protein
VSNFRIVRIEEQRSERQDNNDEHIQYIKKIFLLTPFAYLRFTSFGNSALLHRVDTGENTLQIIFLDVLQILEREK